MQMTPFLCPRSKAGAISALLIVSAWPAFDLATPAAAQDQKTIRIMVARSISAVPMLSIGPFAEKYGLKTEILPFATNGEMQNGLRSGSAELGQLGLQNPAILADQGATDVKVIFGYATGAQNLIVRKEAKIKSWKDLEGKTIGRAPGTYTGILFTLAAQENNVDLSKVKLVNTTAFGTAELQALKNGDLDGLAMYSPIIDRAVVEGYAEYASCCDILSTKRFGRANQIYAANTSFLGDRATAVKLVKAYLESEDFYLKNPEKALEITAKFTGVPRTVLDESVKHFSWDHRVDRQAIINVAKEGVTFGFTKTDTSPKVADLIDLSFLSEATGKPVDQLSSLGGKP
jgi:ABC-type nitrate/sulfonate/bicarbonate transport system substrate-binding protein